jgi:hypothetical protein
MYTNMPIVDENRKQPYGDTPKPKVYGASSPFDPQIFSTVNETAPAKLSQEDVARWFFLLSGNAKAALVKMPSGKSAECRRWQLDVQILAGIGNFFCGEDRRRELLESVLT